eukprot:TRINITY_DN3967_c0_g1_i1.p1 TRINITY_DN3967_c0_g1~~TRINITY_DN3967_c0_g1_i1.p1  ORF type:complete len:559 (-),score=81.18 TRINITY_DN3967_c0_g1_i1:66-1538(-)
MFHEVPTVYDIAAHCASSIIQDCCPNFPECDDERFFDMLTNGTEISEKLHAYPMTQVASEASLSDPSIYMSYLISNYWQNFALYDSTHSGRFALDLITWHDSPPGSIPQDYDTLGAGIYTREVALFVTMMTMIVLVGGIVVASTFKRARFALGVLSRADCIILSLFGFLFLFSRGFADFPMDHQSATGIYGQLLCFCPFAMSTIFFILTISYLLFCFQDFHAILFNRRLFVMERTSVKRKLLYSSILFVVVTIFMVIMHSSCITDGAVIVINESDPLEQIRDCLHHYFGVEVNNLKANISTMVLNGYSILLLGYLAYLTAVAHFKEGSRVLMGRLGLVKLTHFAFLFSFFVFGFRVLTLSLTESCESVGYVDAFEKYEVYICPDLPLIVSVEPFILILDNLLIWLCVILSIGNEFMKYYSDLRMRKLNARVLVPDHIFSTNTKNTFLDPSLNAYKPMSRFGGRQQNSVVDETTASVQVPNIFSNDDGGPA